MQFSNFWIAKGNMPKGKVKWFNRTKGYGFIEQESGEDIFVHQSEIQQEGFRYLEENEEVEFEIGEGRKGPCALKVQRLQSA